MKNFERIKNMSVEEMTVFLDEFSGMCIDCVQLCKNEDCPIYKEGRYCRPQEIKEWLESEVKE